MRDRRRWLPSKEVLRSLLDYNPDTGALTWRPRHASMFEHNRFGADWGQSKWNTRYAGKPALAGIDGEGYHAGAIFHTKHRAHRVIWKWMTGDDPEIVDHINGDRLDNRWANLRETNDQGNARNSARPSNNTSGHVGVSFNQMRRRWVAYIRIGGRHTHLGSFHNRDEAIAARQRAQSSRPEYHVNHGRAAQ